MPAAAQALEPRDPSVEVEGSKQPEDYSGRHFTDPWPGSSSQTLSERRALRPYREYDWYRPEPGKTGYFADDYRRSWPGAKPATLGNGDRVYRGRDLHYYCRRWDGSTQPLEASANAKLGDALAAGGTEKLRKLAASNPALAVAIKRREIRCGGDARVLTLDLPNGL